MVSQETLKYMASTPKFINDSKQMLTYERGNAAKVIKAQMLIRTGMYNKDIEMCYKGLEKFKKYTLCMLEQIESNPKIIVYDYKTFAHTEGHSETYRQYANWIKKHYDAYKTNIETLKSDGWFET